MSDLEILAGGVAIAAVPGDSVLSAMLRAEAEIQTVCKGKGICGACRIRVAEADAMRLAPASARERRMLDFLRSREPCPSDAHQRLACQIVLDATLDRLTIFADPVKPKPLKIGA